MKIIKKIKTLPFNYGSVFFLECKNLKKYHFIIMKL